jgi:diguanylate cyclase (GGDEF)-like protein/PAS domain S-box-containing protein
MLHIEGPSRRRIAQVIEAAFLFILLAFFSYGIGFPQQLSQLLAYAVFPLLIWAVVRFGLNGGVTAIIVVAVVAVCGTIQGTGHFFHDPTGLPPTRLLGFVATVILAVVILERYLAQHRRARKAEKEKHDFLQTIIDGVPNPIMVISADYQVLLLNRAALKIAQVSDPNAERLLCYRITHHLPAPCKSTDHPCPMSQVCRHRKPVTLEHIHYDAEGRRRIVQVTAAPLWKEDGSLWAIIESTQDITDRKKAEMELLAQKKRLEYAAQHDPLTDLPNRLMLQDRLHQSLRKARRRNTWVALLFLDLDRFKHVNDTLGHQRGDQLLRLVAIRLRECVREEDTIARFGGDEFTILLEAIERPSAAAVVAHKVIEALMRPFELNHQPVYIGTSIGISLYPTDGDDVDTLIKHADTAMYLAKERGRSNYQFYSQTFDDKTRRQFNLETHLRQALANNELRVHYQPQMQLGSGKIVSAEALLRWQSPELGSVYPNEFIPLAEETGLINHIGEWVLHAACEQSAAWQKGGLPPLRIAVNLSLSQFADQNLIETVRDTLADTGLEPNLLELELTESVCLHNRDKAIALMTEIRQLGVRLSIDDFGTGFSSLAYLKDFPLDHLKVAQEFVGHIPKNTRDAAIATSIISLAKSLGLVVIAEGVETTEHLEFCQAHGCDLGQGFHFGRAMAAEDFARHLCLVKKVHLGT